MSERKCILIVDDQQPVLFVLEHALRWLGDDYEIIAFEGAEDALQEARAVSLALVITDIRMEPMDGVALTRAIREFDSRVPVVWITAYGDRELQAQAAELSVYCCLRKPLEIHEIRRVAREAMAGAEGASAQER